MDHSAMLWNVETGARVATLQGHSAEIVSLCFNADGNRLLTGSFDSTAKIWDVSEESENIGAHVWTLAGHKGEISSVEKKCQRRLNYHF